VSRPVSPRAPITYSGKVSQQLQARTPGEAFWTLDPQAVVTPSHPWFTDLDQMLRRDHYGVRNRLERQLGPSPTRPEFVHVALMGHPGMGKSTVARNALDNLSKTGLNAVFIDSVQAFDQADFTFSDMVLVLAETVMRALIDLEIDIDPAPLAVLHNWFAEELVTEEHRTALLGSVETQAEASISVPLVAKIAAKVTAALKSNHEYRTQIRRRAQRDPSELLQRVNTLLDAVHVALKPRSGQLCVVFDNLEKTRHELVDRAVIQRAEEFRRLRCNTLLFFSPMSEYSPLSTPLSRVFTPVIVPALPVRFPGDAPEVIRPEALAAIEQLLSKRLLLDAVFDDPKACVAALAAWSGGHLRDLLGIARRAVENVEPAKITVLDIDRAAQWLGTSMLSSFQAGDLTRAVEIHRTHRVMDSERDRRLLRNSCVLQYNGSQWWDVHPAIRADPLFLDALGARPEHARPEPTDA